MFSKVFLKDMFERAASTYVQAFIAAWMVAGATNWGVITNALFAAIPATLAVVKASLARFVGDKESAAISR